MLEFAKIVVFATLAAMIYGILHDQVTAHVCVEYFTVAHPPVFPTESPFWLAVGWGIIATWWVGLPLGLGLALAARVGQKAPLSLRELRPRIIALMAFSGACALAAGLAGLVVSGINPAAAIGIWTEVISIEKWNSFGFDLWAHSASYFTGFVGGVVLIIETFLRRRKMELAPGFET